jgi:hypothetical protein
VTIEFFSSTGRHTFTLEQDGNWIKGSHQGDFAVRDLVGTIDGDRIVLRSVPTLEGDSLPYIFSGTLSGDSFSGEVHLGEYRTAKFTARKHGSNGKRERILVPGGPPLATE